MRILYKLFLYAMAGLLLCIAVPTLMKFGAFVIGIVPLIAIALVFIALVSTDPFKWS